MSTLLTVIILLLVMILAPTDLLLAGRSSHCCTVGAARPVVASARRESVPWRVRLHHRQPFYRGRAADGCMPRGFWVPPSAPSRYVNYHTLGTGGMCDHGGHQKKP